VSKLITIIIRLALPAVGLGFAGLGLAAPAQADARQDQDFYRLLTEPDQSQPMVIWNFPLVRSQGIQSCQREDAGETPIQSTNELVYPYGAYTFEAANSLTSAADTIYCPWHGVAVSAPGWARIPTPVFPLPIYPPIAWYPTPAYPSYPSPVGYMPPG
jgi:hypothetical protein